MHVAIVVLLGIASGQGLWMLSQRRAAQLGNRSAASSIWLGTLFGFAASLLALAFAGNGWNDVEAAPLLAALLIMAVTDLFDERYVYDVVSIPAVVYTLAISIANGRTIEGLIGAALGCALGFGLQAALPIFGGADVYGLILLCTAFGWAQGWFACVLALLVAALATVRGLRIPRAPAPLFVGIVVAVLVGMRGGFEPVIHAYVR
jgi:hypothetical protein